MCASNNASALDGGLSDASAAPPSPPQRGLAEGVAARRNTDREHRASAKKT